MTSERFYFLKKNSNDELSSALVELAKNVTMNGSMFIVSTIFKPSFHLYVNSDSFNRRILSLTEISNFDSFEIKLSSNFEDVLIFPSTVFLKRIPFLIRLQLQNNKRKIDNGV